MMKSKPTESMAAPSGTAETAPMIIYGKRRIKAGMVEEFTQCYEVFAQSVYESNPAVKILFAFPEQEDPLVYWHVLWTADLTAFGNDAVRPPVSARLWATYASSPEDPDTPEVYGGWNDEIVETAKSIPWVRYRFHTPLAGFIKPDGAGEQGPAMLGFTRRNVKEGRVDELARTFQKVCDRWYETVPGILAATVSRDHDDPNVVHDIRIMLRRALRCGQPDMTKNDSGQALS